MASRTHGKTRRWPFTLAAVLGLLGLAVGGLLLWMPGFASLFAVGDARNLRPDASVPAKTTGTSLLLLAIDGVDRPLLYEMLRSGELPETRALLGGGETLPHAYLDETMLTTLPSTTLPAWATVFTGEPPARHGVTGNEYFVRETRTYVGPAPVSVTAPDLVMRTFSDGYANELLAVPTVYERLRARDPAFTAWVSMSQFYVGADRLLLSDRAVIAEAFAALASGLVEEDDDDRMALYSKLDREAMEQIEEALAERAPPRMLTVYISGADNFAHGAEAGPIEARQRYLRDVVDPLFGRLRRALAARDALEDRAVLLVADHGHMRVQHDEAHALSTNDDDDPPAVVRGAGFRLRPFEYEVDADVPFDAVLMYGGAMAYAYVADRSTCRAPEQVCDWTKPPRFEEDVLPLAEAFYQANASGSYAPSMRGALDMILVRRSPAEGDALPFDVYLGDGRVEPLAATLARVPRAAYVAFDERLRELAVGPKGDHAGEILLLARNGNEPSEATRFYFAGLYHSWHGSPSRADSEVPLILAHPQRSTAELGALVRRIAGPTSAHTDVTPLIESLLAD